LSILFVERVHAELNVRLVHFHEKILDAILVLVVVHNEEARVAGSHKRRHKPLVELVHCFQIHVVGAPHVLIYQVKRCVCNELNQMPMVFFLQLAYLLDKEINIGFKIHTLGSLVFGKNSISKMGLSNWLTM